MSPERKASSSERSPARRQPRARRPRRRRPANKAPAKQASRAGGRRSGPACPAGSLSGRARDPGPSWCSGARRSPSATPRPTSRTRTATSQRRPPSSTTRTARPTSAGSPSQNRTSIPLSDVPRNVQDAVIAAEDRTFYTNKGIDPKGILRAAFSNARGGSTQGASTITQQYVKVFYLSQERTLKRKVKEAFVSLKLQRQQSKDQILQGYLNTIYFGRGAYGIQAAAQAYFDVDAKDLNVRQGAVLASILNSPAAMDPAGGQDNRQRLLGRYQYVLNGMAAMGDLDAGKAERLGAHLPKFPKSKTDNQYGGQKGHMLALVKKQLHRQGVLRGADPPRRAQGDDHLHPQRHGRGREGGARPEAAGAEEAARRGRHRRPRDRRAEGDVRRPGLPQEPDQLGHGGRLARLGVQAVRAGGRDRRRLLPEEHVPGQLAVRLPERRQGRQRGRWRRQRLRRPGLAAHGDRAVDQHRVRGPHRVDGQRAAEDPRHRRRRWGSRATRRG